MQIENNVYMSSEACLPVAHAGPWLAGSRHTWDRVVSDSQDLSKLTNLNSPNSLHFHMLHMFMFFPMKLAKYPKRVEASLPQRPEALMPLLGILKRTLVGH